MSVVTVIVNTRGEITRIRRCIETGKDLPTIFHPECWRSEGSISEDAGVYERQQWSWCSELKGSNSDYRVRSAYSSSFNKEWRAAS